MDSISHPDGVRFMASNLDAYRALEARFHRLGALGGVVSVLNWDWSTVMPPGGAEARAELLAQLKIFHHEILTDAAVADQLAAAEVGAGELDPWQRANLAEMRRASIHATALEPRLVEALSRAASKTEGLWREAKPKGDFALVRPALAELLALVREAAAAKAAKLGVLPYEALLDEFEPDGRVAEIDRIFAELAGFLPDLRERVLARQEQMPKAVAPRGSFPAAAQKALALRLMAALGFEFGHGRLDESLHPFSGGVPDDVRITTRYDEADFAKSLMGVLHETGHALYSRGLPAAWRYQPVGEARGMTIHESQSLLIEMQACRSPAFLGFLAPHLAEAFGPDPTFEPANLARLYGRVEPGFIRVDADEVCYPSHVILRYRLERAMIEDRLPLADLPAAWNDGMDELLGIRPPNDREGCLQDIHWFDGAWGYFPTYTFGAIAAAQLYDAACRARPEIPDAIARGDFSPLLGWLRPNVHALAASRSTDAILRHATGQPLDPGVFKAHLERRYLS